MIKVYWWDKCSTCRKMKVWMDEQGVDYELIDLLTSTPSKEQLITWMKNNPYQIRRYFNTSGAKYRKLGLKDKVDKLTTEQAAELLASDGMLIRRPILVKGERVTFGFRINEFEDILGLK